MGFKFRKSFKVSDGVRMNVGKKGVSLSMGGKGARYTVSSTGRKTRTVGIPGTGISYSKSSSNKSIVGSFFGWLIVIAIGMAFAIYGFGFALIGAAIYGVYRLRFRYLTPDKYKAEQDRLLDWQNAVLEDKSDTLIVKKRELKKITKQLSDDDIRIVNDCAKIIDTTLNPQVFFMRINLMKEKIEHLKTIDEYMEFNPIYQSDVFTEMLENYNTKTKEFLDRYFADVIEKAQSLKTDKGKHNRYTKAYETLQEFYCFMSEENIDFIENKYRELKGGDASN